MRNGQKIGTVLTCMFLLGGTAAVAEPGEGHEGGQNHEGAQNHEAAQNHEPAHNHGPEGRGGQRGEAHQGPQGYQRVAPPKGWDARPAQADRSVYQHNFRAARSFHVGPYHRPAGWAAHTWSYGQILPRAYWAPQYILADYWLFALEVPPAGYEWVRDGSDALLISTDSGEILQVEYGVFA